MRKRTVPTSLTPMTLAMDLVVETDPVAERVEVGVGRRLSEDVKRLRDIFGGTKDLAEDDDDEPTNG